MRDGVTTRERCASVTMEDLLVQEAVVVGRQRSAVQEDVSVLLLVEALQQTHTGAFSFSRPTH